MFSSDWIYCRSQMEIFEPTETNIRKAGQLLRDNQLVAFPTETVYGLGANATSSEAVERIFKAKGRPSDNPLIVHVASLEDAKPFVEKIDQLSQQLAHAFWPGPLTIVLPLDGACAISSKVTAGLNTVGIRVPEHPVALALLREARVPLAAPSANKSGSPSPTLAQHVFNDFKNSSTDHVRPSMIINGGACQVGLESTVVQVVEHENEIHILRPGKVSPEMIAQRLHMDPTRIKRSYTVKEVEVPRAPGMKYKHYSPKAVVLAVSDWSNVAIRDGDIVVSFDTTMINGSIDRSKRFSFGASECDVETASSRLFDLFRRADEVGASRVLVDCSFDIHSGLGAALWNRISKAASV